MKSVTGSRGRPGVRSNTRPSPTRVRNPVRTTGPLGEVYVSLYDFHSARSTRIRVTHKEPSHLTSTRLVGQSTGSHLRRGVPPVAGLRSHPLNLIRVTCLLYTSDAADEEDSVDLGGRRII